MHKFDPANIELLIGEERYKGMDPLEFLRLNGVIRGMHIADVGCGPGFFTLPASEIVGESGKVYAVDSEEDMLKAVKRKTPPENIIIVKSDESHIPLENGSCDMVLLAFVLHEAEEKLIFLNELKRLLRPEGRLILLDWEKKTEEKGPPFEERIEKTEAVRLIERAGFEIEETVNINPSHYKIAVRKKPEA
jgi:ubiquinone/menaquinone biosynthesis C-methylase UbiE